MIEMMARAICTAHGGDADEWWESWVNHARAALSVLAANVSDEMVEAYTRSYYNGDEFLVREIMRNERDVQANKVAIAAALTSAAGDEDRRA